MIIGIPQEIKAEEYRAGATPAGVNDLTQNGHKVLVESGAGEGSSFSDKEYRQAGADIVETAEEVYRSEMIIKVKEPLESEYDLLQEDQIIFTYFHLAASEQLTQAMLEAGIVGIAYETVEENGQLPLLRPMSEVAGRMSPLVGSYFLQKFKGGAGILPPGIPGVRPARTLVIGGGTVGSNAARVAANLGSQVTIMEIDEKRMRQLEQEVPRASVLKSTPHNIKKELKRSDLVVGAVLIPGGQAPTLINEQDLKDMKDGSVIVDVAVDQGGITATTRPTTHHNPTYQINGVTHYAVANMPGAFPRTATIGLTNATLDYALKIANRGWKRAAEIKAINKGINVCQGRLTNKKVAEAFDMNYESLESL